MNLITKIQSGQPNLMRSMTEAGNFQPTLSQGFHSSPQTKNKVTSLDLSIPPEPTYTPPQEYINFYHNFIYLLATKNKDPDTLETCQTFISQVSKNIQDKCLKNILEKLQLQEIIASAKLAPENINLPTTLEALTKPGPLGKVTLPPKTLPCFTPIHKLSIRLHDLINTLKNKTYDITTEFLCFNLLINTFLEALDKGCFAIKGHEKQALKDAISQLQKELDQVKQSDNQHSMHAALSRFLKKTRAALIDNRPIAHLFDEDTDFTTPPPIPTELKKWHQSIKDLILTKNQPFASEKIRMTIAIGKALKDVHPALVADHMTSLDHIIKTLESFAPSKELVPLLTSEDKKLDTWTKEIKTPPNILFDILNSIPKLVQPKSLQELKKFANELTEPLKQPCTSFTRKKFEYYYAFCTTQEALSEKVQALKTSIEDNMPFKDIRDLRDAVKYLAEQTLTTEDARSNVRKLLVNLSIQKEEAEINDQLLKAANTCILGKMLQSMRAHLITTLEDQEDHPLVFLFDEKIAPYILKRILEWPQEKGSILAGWIGEKGNPESNLHDMLDSALEKALQENTPAALAPFLINFLKPMVHGLFQSLNTRAYQTIYDQKTKPSSKVEEKWPPYSADVEKWESDLRELLTTLGGSATEEHIHKQRAFIYTNYTNAPNLRTTLQKGPTQENIEALLQALYPNSTFLSPNQRELLTKQIKRALRHLDLWKQPSVKKALVPNLFGTHERASLEDALLNKNLQTDFGWVGSLTYYLLHSTNTFLHGKFDENALLEAIERGLKKALFKVHQTMQEEDRVSHEATNEGLLEKLFGKASASGNFSAFGIVGESLQEVLDPFWQKRVDIPQLETLGTSWILGFLNNTKEAFYKILQPQKTALAKKNEPDSPPPVTLKDTAIKIANSCTNALVKEGQELLALKNTSKTLQVMRRAEQAALHKWEAFLSKKSSTKSSSSSEQIFQALDSLTCLKECIDAPEVHTQTFTILANAAIFALRALDFQEVNAWNDVLYTEKKPKNIRSTVSQAITYLQQKLPPVPLFAQQNTIPPYSAEFETLRGHLEAFLKDSTLSKPVMEYAQTLHKDPKSQDILALFSEENRRSFNKLRLVPLEKGPPRWAHHWIQKLDSWKNNPYKPTISQALVRGVAEDYFIGPPIENVQPPKPIHLDQSGVIGKWLQMLKNTLANSILRKDEQTITRESFDHFVAFPLLRFLSHHIHKTDKGKEDFSFAIKLLKSALSSSVSGFDQNIKAWLQKFITKEIGFTETSIVTTSSQSLIEMIHEFIQERLGRRVKKAPPKVTWLEKHFGILATHPLGEGSKAETLDLAQHFGTFGKYLHRHLFEQNGAFASILHRLLGQGPPTMGNSLAKALAALSKKLLYMVYEQLQNFPEAKGSPLSKQGMLQAVIGTFNLNDERTWERVHLTHCGSLGHLLDGEIQTFIDQRIAIPALSTPLYEGLSSISKGLLRLMNNLLRGETAPPTTLPPANLAQLLVGPKEQSNDSGLSGSGLRFLEKKFGDISGLPPTSALGQQAHKFGAYLTHLGKEIVHTPSKQDLIEQLRREEIALEEDRRRLEMLLVKELRDETGRLEEDQARYNQLVKKHV